MKESQKRAMLGNSREGGQYFKLVQMPRMLKIEKVTGFITITPPSTTLKENFPHFKLANYHKK